MRFTPSRPLLALVLVLLAGLVLTPSAWGQEERREEGRRERGRFGGRGGFGGFERGGGGMLGTLRDEAVQQELGLTEEQKEQIETISESARPSGDFFSQFRELRNLSDEEREKRMAEFRQQMEDRRRESEAKLKDVLKDEQYTRLQQISLRNAGTRGLLQDEVAAELKLSDEQKTQIREILESREGFSDFRSMTPEDFQRIRDEREAKALALLSEEQKQAWEKKLGPAPEEGEATADRDSDERPDRGSSERPRRTAASNPDSGTVILPDGTTRSPMSSFGGSEQQANAGSAPTETKRLSFNFYQAPWADVLRLFASVAGLTIDLKDVPPGTFSYYDPNEYTPTEALDIINGYLLPRGYILVRRDNFLVSLNIEDGVPPNLVPTVNVSELPQRGRNELVSVILPLQPGLDPAEISKEVEGLLGPQGKVVPLATPKSLMLQDLASNLLELTQLLSDIAVPQSDDAMVFKRLPLEHMLATEAERQIRRLFGLDTATRNVSRAAESGGSSRSMSSFFERFRRGGNDNDRDRDRNSSSMLQAMQAMTPQIHVSSDPRTNSVLVKAQAADMKLIEDMLEAIDVPESDDAKRIAGNNTPVLRVYTLGEAEAEEVAKTLDAIMPGVVVNEDGRNDMIHVMATPLEHEEIEVLVQRLDGAGGQTIDVIKLARTDPVQIAQYLTAMFANVDRDIAPAIQPDPMTRSLIVRGSMDQVGQIRKMLLAYGEDGNGGSRLSRGTGRVRSVPLAGRDPERVARMVETILSGSKDFGNEIRVVVPSESRIEDRRSPAATRRESPENTRPTRARSADRDSEIDLRTERPRRPSTFMASLREEPAPEESTSGQSSQPEEIDSTPASVDPREALREGEQKEPGDAKQRAASRVNIEVLDGDLVIYSADEEALDEVEGLIGELANQMPSRSEWVQFYLLVADATEAAFLLEQMVADSFGSENSYEYSRYSRYRGSPPITNPQTLKIIPDLRTNSLFVSGPNDKIREVEQFLQRIDAAETPQSLRDRLPRTIPVVHADILQVAQMIRDLYATDMADPNARNDREGRGSSRPANVRLTLAVDTRASELIVSCDDALFREIEEIVYERDQAAFEGQPTVQVIELNPGSSAMVQQALTSLSPKILVSTSGTSRTPNQNQTDPNANRSNQSGSDNRSGDDARRDFFRQMMERRSEGGDRGSDRGSSDWRSRFGGGDSDWRSRFGGGDSSRWSRGRGRD